MTKRSLKLRRRRWQKPASLRVGFDPKSLESIDFDGLLKFIDIELELIFLAKTFKYSPLSRSRWRRETTAWAMAKSYKQLPDYVGENTCSHGWFVKMINRYAHTDCRFNRYNKLIDILEELGLIKQSGSNLTSKAYIIMLWRIPKEVD